MTLSRFSDLSEAEFVNKHLKYRPSANKVASVDAELLSLASKHGAGNLGAAINNDESDLPKSFTWTDPPKGYGKVVAPVHNQQDICASCWAFVTADSIAGRWAVMNKGEDIEELSVKQLMVCDQQDNGCNTGNMYTAYDWIDENGGIATKKEYDSIVPGEVQDDESAQCSTAAKLALNTPGMCDLKMTAGNRALMIAIHQSGPVAIGINANNLQFYESGIIDAASCPPAGRGIQSINHAALVVGWGEEDGKKYWLVKNSYGTDFGENGYFKLERNDPSSTDLFGTCGLLFESVYPAVTKVGDHHSALGVESQCTEGSVYKKNYYRNEVDNPGATATAMAAADAAVAAAASAALGRVRPIPTEYAAVAQRAVGHGKEVAQGKAWLSETGASVVKGISLLVAAAGIAVIGFHYGSKPNDYQPVHS